METAQSPCVRRFAMEGPDTIDFSALERELQAAVAADEKYQRENNAKFRAVHQKVASYEEFRDIVLASHLRPLERKDKLGGKRNQPWNSCASPAGSQQGSGIEVSQELSGEPKTAAEFHRDWRRCLKGGTEKYQFLLQLGAETLGRIFHADLAFGLLGELVTTLAENVRRADHAAVVQILASLCATSRFGLNLDFLSAAEKESCRRLFQELQTGSIPSGMGTDREGEGEREDNPQIPEETGWENHVDQLALRDLMARYQVT